MQCDSRPKVRTLSSSNEKWESLLFCFGFSSAALKVIVIDAGNLLHADGVLRSIFKSAWCKVNVGRRSPDICQSNNSACRCIFPFFILINEFKEIYPLLLVNICTSWLYIYLCGLHQCSGGENGFNSGGRLQNGSMTHIITQVKPEESDLKVITFFKVLALLQQNLCPPFLCWHDILPLCRSTRFFMFDLNVSHFFLG